MIQLGAILVLAALASKIMGDGTTTTTTATVGHGVIVKPGIGGRCPAGYFLSGDGLYCVKV